MSGISIDISFFVQVVSLLLLWFGLKQLIVDPMLGVLEAREQRTSGTQHAAAEMRARSERDAASYAARLDEIRRQIANEVAAERVAIAAAERQVLSAAREQAGVQLAQLRESLSRQAEEARVALTSEAQTLATQMFDRVVGRPAA